MDADSISLPQRRMFGRNRSPVDESLSFSASETSAQSGRRLNERSAIFSTRFEYALVIIGLQTGTTQLMFLFLQVEKYGFAMVFLTTFIITIFITLPLMVNQTFYGFYNKFGYIKFWNMAPVAFGIGISMVLYNLFESVRWAAVAGLLVLYLCYTPFRRISEWTICRKIERPEGVTCYDIVSKLPKKSCDVTTYPALEFYKEISFKKQLEGNGINGAWFVCCVIVWLITFAMVSQGFRRLKRIMIVLPIFCLLSLVSLLAFSFATQEKLSVEDKVEIFSIDVDITRYTLVWWVWHCIRVVQIPQGTLSQLGSYSPPGSLALADSVMILIFVFLYNFTFAYFGYCCHVWIQLNFLNIHHKCLAPDSLSVLFASVPTAISFLAMGKLWLVIFYLSFTLKIMAQIVITLTATMNAMSEMFHLHRRRQQIVAVFCTVALLLNLPITMIDSELFIKRTSRYIELLVDLNIVNCTSLVIMCLYTLSRVFDDMHFTYNSEPVMFQKLITCLSPILMIFIVIAAVDSVAAAWPKDPLFDVHPWAAPFIIIVIILILLPIPGFALYMYIVQLMRHDISAMLQPTPTWGPPEPDVKRARINFNPRFELRHRSKKPCAHSCLLNNLRVKIEFEKRESQRREFFLNILQNPGYAEWDEDEDWHHSGDMIGKARTINWTGGVGRIFDEELMENKKDKMIHVEYVDATRKDINFREDSKEYVKVDTTHDTLDAAMNEKLISNKDNEIETEMEFQPDIILPDLNSIELHPRNQHPDTRGVTHRSFPSPRYTVKHRTFLRQRKSERKSSEAETEPPSTRKMYPKSIRQPKRQSKSCQTERGLKRLQNIIRSILPWRKGNRKKHRCVGTSPDTWSPMDCSRRPNSRVSRETFSEIDEWP